MKLNSVTNAGLKKIKTCFQFTVSRLRSKLSLNILRLRILRLRTFFDSAQNLPTIFKLTSLGVNRLGRAYTLLAKSLMS